ncbi:MAG: hypothetical protein WCL32_11755 [Planctomycetota bacterium]
MIKTSAKLVGFVAASVAILLTLAGTGVADSKDGARRWTKVLKKNTEVVYKIVFIADKNPQRGIAEFAVIGDGSTDVDIEVYDSKGAVVAKDDRFTDLALVRWVPMQTQEYTIKVINLGSEDNACLMGHN